MVFDYIQLSHIFDNLAELDAFKTANNFIR